MKKTEPGINEVARQLVGEYFNQGRIVDQNAVTSAELAAAYGMSRSTVSRRLKNLVGRGVFEMVWKKVNGTYMAAYRKKVVDPVKKKK